MDKILFLLILILQVLNAVNISTQIPTIYPVDGCPLTNTSWSERSNRLQCERGGAYHCLKTMNSSTPLVELCFSVKILNSKDGCPILEIRGREGRPHIQQEKCNHRFGNCPKHLSDDIYNSNELYKYGGCIIIPSEKMGKISPADTRSFQDGIRTKTERKDKQIPLTNQINAFAGVSICLSIGLIYSIVVFVQCMRIKLHQNLIQALNNGKSTTTEKNTDNHLCSEFETYAEIAEIDDRL